MRATKPWRTTAWSSITMILILLSLIRRVQTSGTSARIPRSGSDLQPRVAAAATLGIEFQPAQPRWGCVLLRTPVPNVAAERQRWAGGRNRFAVSKSGIALTLVLFTNLLDLFGG